MLQLGGFRAVARHTTVAVATAVQCTCSLVSTWACTWLGTPVCLCTQCNLAAQVWAERVLWSAAQGALLSLLLLLSWLLYK